MFCQKCGKEVNDEAVVCIHCGCALGNSQKTSIVSGGTDEINPGWIIASIFIPLIGIILWPIKHKEAPKAARTYGLTGIIAMIAWWLIYFFLFFMIEYMYW